MDGNFEVQQCSKARFNACMNQCRIVKFMDGGTVFDGNCPCERPMECRFGLADKLDAVEPDEMFADAKIYMNQLFSELQ